MKSQNNEAEIIREYFKDFRGELNLLSIGENDGQTFSNTYDLLNDLNSKVEWTAHLVEPSKTAFDRLEKLYDAENIYLYNFGIAEETGHKKFYESKNHLIDDVALLSSLSLEETNKWRSSVNFNEVEAYFVSFVDFLKINPLHQDYPFHFITIDAEGYDWVILQQIDLFKHNCNLLCIEHNGKQDLLNKYRQYAEYNSMMEVSLNAENIIFRKKGL